VSCSKNARYNSPLFSGTERSRRSDALLAAIFSRFVFLFPSLFFLFFLLLFLSDAALHGTPAAKASR
jgi:hypothetical protein